MTIFLTLWSSILLSQLISLSQWHLAHLQSFLTLPALNIHLKLETPPCTWTRGKKAGGWSGEADLLQIFKAPHPSPCLLDTILTQERPSNSSIKNGQLTWLMTPLAPWHDLGLKLYTSSWSLVGLITWMLLTMLIQICQQWLLAFSCSTSLHCCLSHIFHQIMKLSKKRRTDTRIRSRWTSKTERSLCNPFNLVQKGAWALKMTLSTTSLKTIEKL